MRTPFSLLLLALPLVLTSPVPDDSISTTPWPPSWPRCIGRLSTATCNKYGLRICTNGCLYWSCGLCFGYTIPEISIPQFPWPPLELGPLDNGVVLPYEKVTEKDLVGWLEVRGVVLEKGVVGKEAVFEVVVGELGKVACKAGVQGGMILE